MFAVTQRTVRQICIGKRVEVIGGATVVGVVAGEEGGWAGAARRSQLTIAGVVGGDNWSKVRLRCS